VIRKSCTACGLHHTRRQIVRGRGTIPAEILFIGEAPGKSEDLIGEAFIGPAGKVLSFLMEDAGILDSNTWYILNCCACRPCDSKSHPNREPKPHEILACMKNVHEEIRRVNPEKVVLLGKIATTYYGKEYPRALKLVHPSYLLRTGGRASPAYSLALRDLKEFTKDNIDPALIGYGGDF
jgi:uracil-DNA glycosylase